uniref:uncharacterized protein LOC122591985 n=1 Tax=Erigeron canadensis TaxID=72917 RepID=UPI001CB974C4|nr:uncharacterized protein LOC122591985 [Erigeron canadensis]
MRQKYIDAMTLVQKFGKPDIFLTMTCNPNWPEIKDLLIPQEESQNRADLVVRAFHARLELLKENLFKKHIFGEVAAYTYVIEFQKRCLPHAHFLIILKPHCKMYRPEEYDEIVSAEIPNEKDNHHLYKMVVKHMLHGPCGILNVDNVCMKKNGTCKNSYPRPYSNETTQTSDAYPIYQRRKNGVTVKVRKATLDNRWVIPYNPYLLAKFDCHINVDICSTIKAVKYIYKYICKGCDRISFVVSSNNDSTLIDEIDQYQSGRWVSAPEATWRFYRTDKLAQDLDLTYSEFPDHFVWLQGDRFWKHRDLGDSVGRIVAAHPTEGEREACLLRGYLVDDNSQQLCLQEASTFHLPYELRRLFATLLVYSCPNNPQALWLAYEDLMVEDLLRFNQMTHKEATKQALLQVNGFLQSMGRNIHEFDLAPQAYSYADLQDLTREIRAEQGIIVSQEDLDTIIKLNEKQKIAFDIIIGRVHSNEGGAFFVDGPGGTGKTYLYRALLAKIRSETHIALATATSGIAASILPGGRTAHSRFKIPLDLVEGGTCRVSKQSSLATLIKGSKLIIWDEAPMAKRTAIEALDDLLQDLMDSKELFGGKVVVLGGDFRQTLPVVRKGTKAETIAACLTKSPLWPSLHILRLEENMRALLDPAFSEFLLKIGNGTQPTDENDLINIPASMLIDRHSETASLDALIESVYPNIQTFSGSCELTEYASFDETIDPNDQTQYEDFLHSLTPNGMPPHRLFLKPNSPIILLRNLNPTEGLCNGTRLICRDLRSNVIHAEIAFGDFAGKEVFIHRIPLQPPTDEDCTVPFKRIQFPIRLCFAMTINKAQGQTLDFVGVYLKEPVFSHRQLYVALSRARTTEHAKVLIRPPLFDAPNVRETKNIVYKEVLQITDDIGGLPLNAGHSVFIDSLSLWRSFCGTHERA